MECANLLEAAIRSGDISKSLFTGSKENKLITELQRVLFELGFRKELKWGDYQADGDYGGATTNAVRAFATKNSIAADGSSVSNKLAKLILQRHKFLSAMYVLWSIHQSDLRTRIYLSKASRTGITAVQVLLNTLGYGKLLKFKEYGADGIYGQSTRKAFVTYANNNGIQSGGDLITRPAANLLIKDASVFYGRHWSDQAPNNLPGGKSPLTLFHGSSFCGNPCRADVKFVPALEKINGYAQDAGVQVYVVSSFRTTTNVKGAIVKPATFSNHLAGHGIDMNLIYGNSKMANSKLLAKYPAVPESVKRFLKSIIDDPELRWGGKFRNADPVHIDDGLNRDMTTWNKRYKAMQNAVQLGKY